VAMRGPRDLPDGADFMDSLGGARDFSPGYYSDILRQYGVRLVVRLNSPEYDAEGFEEMGIAVAELPFEDCTPPPLAVAAKFMTMAEGVTGSLAVHCRAGLGRTGTLIALYMIKHHDFTARQAIGWLRIVRPGRRVATPVDVLALVRG
jgi:cell division cycle 14